MAVHRIRDIDIWRAGLQGHTATIYVGGTTTLADVFTDEALSAAAANPQLLISGTIGTIQAGKLAVPLYTSQPYTLSLSTGDATGIERPRILTLAGEDASLMHVTVPGSAQVNDIRNIVSRVVWAEAWGADMVTASPATNNTTLNAAIGALPAGGGRVLLPPGTIEYTDLDLGAGVVLEGAGRDATTLVCTTGGHCVTVSGERAGLKGLTHDGLSLVAGGVGLFSKGIDRIVLDDVRMKRFETGLHAKGGRFLDWSNFYIDACATGAKLHGDVDSGGGSDGDVLAFLRWRGGNVINCTVIGVDLSYEDREIYNVTLDGVDISDNTGIALNINGAHSTLLANCNFDGNLQNMTVDDDSLTTVDDNKVEGLTIRDTRMHGGGINFTGQCKNVLFERTDLLDVHFSLTTPGNHILLLDCVEDRLTTVSGTGSNTLIRRRTNNHGSAVGTTNDAVATKAWGISLEPGQVVYLEAKVLGHRTNAVGHAIYHIGCGAYRPGSELDYDTQTANFTTNDTITGGTSGATARILFDNDSGSTGTLTLDNIVGVFENNEVITSQLGGSALVDGTITDIDAALDTTGNVNLRAVYETSAGYLAAFAAPGSSDIELRVTGIASHDMEWTVEVDVAPT